jgi:hypothetical protein
MYLSVLSKFIKSFSDKSGTFRKTIIKALIEFDEAFKEYKIKDEEK